jgi:hypothetical protein
LLPREFGWAAAHQQTETVLELLAALALDRGRMSEPSTTSPASAVRAGQWRARIPGTREEEMFRQRTVEGLTLREIAERHDLGFERIRQILRHYYRLTGFTPAAVERQKQKRERTTTRIPSAGLPMPGADAARGN